MGYQYDATLYHMCYVLLLFKSFEYWSWKVKKKKEAVFALVTIKIANSFPLFHLPPHFPFSKYICILLYQKWTLRAHFHVFAKLAKTTRWQNFGPLSTWKFALIYVGKQKSTASMIVGDCWSSRRGTWPPLFPKTCWCGPAIVVFRIKFLNVTIQTSPKKLHIFLVICSLF